MYYAAMLRTTHTHYPCPHMGGANSGSDLRLVFSPPPIRRSGFGRRSKSGGRHLHLRFISFSCVVLLWCVAKQNANPPLAAVYFTKLLIEL